MESSDLITHKNGWQRKLVGATLPAEKMTDMDEGEMNGSEPEVEEQTASLIIESASEDGKHHPGILGELGNMLLLLFLYVLEGIPLGLAGSIPLILQSKGIGYSYQVLCIFPHLPFSLKLLWAPLVDALYFSRFGRSASKWPHNCSYRDKILGPIVVPFIHCHRHMLQWASITLFTMNGVINSVQRRCVVLHEAIKSWLVPTQYLQGLLMLFLSGTVNSLQQSEEGADVIIFAVIYIVLPFLAATQDIAVDGWALTMLSRANVGYASTCNSVGQAAGYFLGNVFFLVLESTHLCNKYFRTEPKNTGIVTMSGFLFFWGMVFLVSTTLVAIFKRENEHGKEEWKVQEETPGVKETYKLLLSIIKMPTVFTLCVLLLAAKIGFSAADTVTVLRLIEAGVLYEHLLLLTVPIEILISLIISKYAAGPRPLDIFYKAFPLRLLISLEYPLLVCWTSSVKQGGLSVYCYTIVLLSYAVQQMVSQCMFMACMAFYTKVSDPLIGGTYMTLLNTVTNLGGKWPSILAVLMVDPLTYKECKGAIGQSCGSPKESWLCAKEGGVCMTTVDGYYVESVVCVVIGLAWWVWLGKKMRQLQEQSPAAWRCRVNQ